MMEIVFLAATVFAAFATTTFATVYGLRLRWETSSEGRALMAASAASSLLAWAYATNRLDELLVEHAWTAWTIPLRILGWSVLGMVYLWRLCLLRRTMRGTQ